MALVWWLAILFDTYLHIWITILAAPMVLLRSSASKALGAELFRRYWVRERSHRNGIPMVMVAVVAAFAFGLVGWLIPDYWLAMNSGPALFWGAMALGVVAANAGMVITVAAWGLPALRDDKAAGAAVAAGVTVGALAAAVPTDLTLVAMAAMGAALVIILLALAIAGLSVEKALVGSVIQGIGVMAVFLIFGLSIISGTVAGKTGDEILSIIWLVGWALGGMAAVGGLLGTRGLALVATGAGVDIFTSACAIRLIATFQHAAAGLRALPGNWQSFVLQTDLRQRPEVIPGLPEGHMLLPENRYAFWDGVSHLDDWINWFVVGFFWKSRFCCFASA